MPVKKDDDSQIECIRESHRLELERLDKIHALDLERLDREGQIEQQKNDKLLAALRELVPALGPFNGRTAEPQPPIEYIRDVVQVARDANVPVSVGNIHVGFGLPNNGFKS